MTYDHPTAIHSTSTSPTTPSMITFVFFNTVTRNIVELRITPTPTSFPPLHTLSAIFAGSTLMALDWTLRVLPPVFCVFGVAWCVWFILTTRGPHESTRAPPQSEEPKADPIDLAKSRALIESKLITRKVLECSSDGTITFSDPMTRESSSCNAIRKETPVSCCSSDMDSDSKSDTSEDNEEQLPPQDCENDAHSHSCGADEPSSTRPSDLNISSSLRTCLGQNSSLARMVSTFFETEGKDTACGICLMEYDEGDEVCWSPNPECLHAFHKECILDWTVRNPQCPVCRRNFVGNGDDDNV